MRFLLVVFLLIVSNAMFALEEKATYSVIPLMEAITHKKVKCMVTGSYNPNKYLPVCDNSGMHYGKCMDVVIESLLDTFIVLKLDAGTSLVPDDSSLQTMYVTKSVELPLYAKRTIPYNIYAMCGQMHDQSPYYGAVYKVGKLADSIVLNAVRIIEQEYLQNIIGQHFLWSITDNASKEELIKYGGDSVSLNRTCKLLKSNNISNRLTQELDIQNTNSNVKPAYMTIKKLYFYAGILYSLLITGGLVILTISIYRKRIRV